MNKLICLFINTSEADKTIVFLQIDNKKIEKKQIHASRRDQDVLLLIDEIIKEQKIQLQDLTAIEVVTGPGSFTGLRVGVAVANALGYALDIPVNGKKSNDGSSPVEPVYTL